MGGDNKFVAVITKYNSMHQLSRGDSQLNFGSFDKVFTPKLTEIPHI